jgi:hypothetical protein
MPSRQRRLFAAPIAAKVSEITFMFWVVKILTTCGGAAVSDYLALGDRVTGGMVETGLLVIGRRGVRSITGPWSSPRSRSAPPSATSQARFWGSAIWPQGSCSS